MTLPSHTTSILPSLRIFFERCYTRLVAALWRVNPAEIFDGRYYLALHDDVAAARMDPLFHFLRYGARERRNPHRLFDTGYYLHRNPDVARSGYNPLLHFLKFGGIEGRNPHPAFDAAFYLAENPDVAAQKINPLVHFLRYGAEEGRLPHPNLKAAGSLGAYPDVAASGIQLRSTLPAGWAAPGYVCPLHRQALTTDGKSGRCPQCPQPFPIEEGIWLLDVVHRNDRTAFDKQVMTSPIPFDLTRAEAMLGAAGIENLENAKILDVGCGLGDLTAGLAVSTRVRSSNIYAFDHSIESVRIAQRSVQAVSGNCVHFSTQDASRLFFEPESFDVIAGSAVLHHITDYAGFLRTLYALLKPGGTVIFAEPFVEGYLWPCVLLRIAVADLKLSGSDDPELGKCGSIIENTEYRVTHSEEPSLLDPLTDKHYFRIDSLVNIASLIGYRTVRFRNLDKPAFYNDWMGHFMDMYGIRHKALRERAIELYEQLRKTAGPALPGVVSHFRFFSLHK